MRVIHLVVVVVVEEKELCCDSDIINKKIIISKIHQTERHPRYWKILTHFFDYLNMHVQNLDGRPGRVRIQAGGSPDEDNDLAPHQDANFSRSFGGVLIFTTEKKQNKKMLRERYLKLEKEGCTAQLIVYVFDPRRTIIRS
ncbi:hypothetical protein PPL_01960 [Heterostelium album PN500]|uniref:Uncharacterized protein n=1 Tax=Heterostelium pallidum (strain ATCC 26659 / Pp 5 / PN500) TaxID=670386 RepID=D3B0Z3_HETP5|nr:hypothetical protein PPL_01960 [Heterostelium album PN500]EFA84967.1 hypothetical protein PPL_01960 [Heterostelium album PN500]|eukprot:XP_020437077.1 hypothetical protein PPL_01960 [Heterostelium album PN500]